MKRAATIPKFIVALSNSKKDKDYIVHTEYPRCVLSSFSNDDAFEVVEWFDKPSISPAPLAKLMRLAGEAFQNECDKLDADLPTASPDSAEIKLAREESGLTQSEAGALVGAKLRTWQDWESGARNMPPAKWELFLLKRP